MGFRDDLNYAKSCLGISFDLREKPIDTLKHIYEGKDTLAVLPTGYGKSIIFQLLPYLMQRKFEKPLPIIVLIVSPLNSIMQDQVRQLCLKGIKAMYLNSEGTSGHCSTFDSARVEDADDETSCYSSVPMSDFRKRAYHLIYAHPKTVTENKTIGKILRSKEYKDNVCYTVIDEVHMISEWGKEIRIAFSKLGQLAGILPHLALTATATPKETQQLCNTLEFVVVIEDTGRANIFYDIY